jgi:predicted acetyltransferase
LAERDPGPAAPVLVRPLRRDDDLAADLDLSHRAFGPVGADEIPARQAFTALSVDGGRFFGALDGGRVVGTARFLDMTQWWHGRSQPMAGVAGVKVTPEARGRGIGRSLMVALLAEIEARGYPLSALHPATMPLYRLLGWERAGGLYTATIPARSLRGLLPAEDGRPAPRAPLRRAGPGDAAQVHEIIDRAYRTSRACGPVNYSLADSALLLDDGSLFSYLSEDAFLCYAWSGGSSEITVYLAVACTEAAVREIWSLLASHSSKASTIKATAGPADPIGWLTSEPDAGLTLTSPWMLRVIDAPAAVAGRGFPAAVAASVPLDLADTLLPGNAGRWRLTVRDGAGRLTRDPGPGRAAALRLGPRGLAALYAGTPLATLRLTGLARGGEPAADAVLDTVFGGTAYMLDQF